MEENNLPANDDNTRLLLMKETLKFLDGHIERTYKDFDSIDNKARANIAGASLLLSFTATFQILGGGAGSSAHWWYWVLLIVALGLYAGMIITSLKALLPVEYTWPVAANWDDVTYYWDLGSEEVFISQLSSDYIEAINHNRKVLDSKLKSYRQSGYMFGSIVIILVIMTIMRFANL